MDDVDAQTSVLAELLEKLPAESRLAGLHISLDRLLSNGLDPASVRMTELHICVRLGLPVSDASERLPHIFVNCVRMGESGVKLGFMTRRDAEAGVFAQAERIRARLELDGCELCGPVAKPNRDESFFWFLVKERHAPPTVRELLESYDDVILR